MATTPPKQAKEPILSLKQVVYLSLAFCSVAIGIHQTVHIGFFESYWLFMFFLIFVGLFVLDFQKKLKEILTQIKEREQQNPTKVQPKKKIKATK